MTPEADPTSIGNLLLAAGVISIFDLRDGVDHAQRYNMLLGEALIDLGRVNAPLFQTVLDQQRAERAPTTHTKAHAATDMLASARAALAQVNQQLDQLQAVAISITRGSNG